MNHLTCQKTHILAWLNSDNTLSFKLNGVKYLSYPKLDKNGGKYWKVDLTEKDKSASVLSPTTALNKKELELLKSYQEKVEANYKMEEFSKAEIDAYCRWEEEQAAQRVLKEKIEASSQQVAHSLKERLESKHEPVNN